MLKKQFKEICRNGFIQGGEHITKITGLVIDHIVETEKEKTEIDLPLVSSHGNLAREAHKDVIHYYMRPNYLSWGLLGDIEEIISGVLKLEKKGTKVQIIFPLVFVSVSINELVEVFKDD